MGCSPDADVDAAERRILLVMHDAVNDEDEDEDGIMMTRSRSRRTSIMSSTSSMIMMTVMDS
jgi:hypothetical protein